MGDKFGPQRSPGTDSYWHPATDPLTMSDPTRLSCPDCGAEYADRWRCECGHPLEFARRPLPEGPAPDPATFDAREGLWAFTEFLPVEQRVSLGEGMTPLQSAPDWDAEFKLEYVFPTGSFKDRGATTTLSRAVELGVEKVVEDSSGNAGAAIATYAARAGVDAEIYVPASVKDSKLRAIEAAGATPVRIEGSRQDVTDACVDAAVGADGEGTDAWYASHAWNPAFFAGTATFAYETALQRDWAAPDAVVTPLGHGTLFLGAYRGFRALEAAGWIDEIPRLYGARPPATPPSSPNSTATQAARTRWPTASRSGIPSRRTRSSTPSTRPTATRSRSMRWPSGTNSTGSTARGSTPSRRVRSPPRRSRSCAPAARSTRRRT